MDTSDRKHQILTEADTPHHDRYNDMIESVNDIVPVADITERATVAAAVGATSSRPLYVHRADAATGQQLEFTTDGSTWTTVSASLTSVGPQAYAGAFGENAATPMNARKDQNEMVTLDGLITNTVEIASSAAGSWFTLPSGYRPGSLRFGLAFIEGGRIASYQIAASGVVSGIALLVGAYPIPLGRYWSLNQVFKAA